MGGKNQSRVAVYCRCGASMTGHVQPADKREALLKKWWFTHSGEGHGAVSRQTCYKARLLQEGRNAA